MGYTSCVFKIEFLFSVLITQCPRSLDLFNDGVSHTTRLPFFQFCSPSTKLSQYTFLPLPSSVLLKILVPRSS